MRKCNYVIGRNSFLQNYSTSKLQLANGRRYIAMTDSKTINIVTMNKLMTRECNNIIGILLPEYEYKLPFHILTPTGCTEGPLTIGENNITDGTYIAYCYCYNRFGYIIIVIRNGEIYYPKDVSGENATIIAVCDVNDACNFISKCIMEWSNRNE